MKKTLILFIFLCFTITIPYINCIAQNNISFFNLENISNEYFLKDLTNSERYNLYYFEQGGYLIYDKQNEEVCEYSYIKESSPYLNLEEEDIYYFGVSSYVIKKQNKFYDILTDQELNILHLKNKKNINTITKENPQNGNTSNYSVPYSNYFRQLDGIINKFPLNNKLDCGYVAEAMLLSYYSVFYNSDIICPHYMNTINISNDSFQIDDWNNVSCCTQEFKDTILEQYVTDFSSTPQKIQANLQEYLNHQFNRVFEGVNFGTIITEMEVKTILKSGTPVLIFGNFDMVDTNASTGNHVILAYGISEDGFIVAHMGWKSKSEVKINFKYWFFEGGIVYLDISSLPHKHGFYTMVNDQYYCPSENKIYIPESNFVFSHADDQFHYSTCICEKVLKEEHTFTLINDGIRKKLLCKKCGYFIFQRV